jgi:phosphoenolpyruvate carboxykinase (GTP)
MATSGGRTWAFRREARDRLEGQRLTPETVDKDGKKVKAAHPNARFTRRLAVPGDRAEWEDPAGVPIDAFLFGGRRPTVIPLVNQAKDWTHAVFMGSAAGSETTAANLGAVGVVRRDPMAMLPFFGYNAADYLLHWLTMPLRTDATSCRRCSSRTGSARMKKASCGTVSATTPAS